MSHGEIILLVGPIYLLLTRQSYVTLNMLTLFIRTIHTDVLFGLLKNLMKQRDDFKLIGLFYNSALILF